jgi:hypothetical protein
LIARQNSSSGALTPVSSCAVEPPRIVVENVEAAKLVDGGADRRLQAVGVGHVGADRDRVVAGRCAVSSPAWASISAMATFAPSQANKIAVARPIPLPAPVMKATLPVSLGIDLSLPIPIRKQPEFGGLGAIS